MPKRKDVTRHYLYLPKNVRDSLMEILEDPMKPGVFPYRAVSDHCLTLIKKDLEEKRLNLDILEEL